MQLFRFHTLSLLGFAAVALACDPAGPRATGSITLGAGFDSSNFTRLEVRVYANSNESFDPTQIPESSPGELHEDLKDVTFPFQYDLGEALGTTDEPRWRMTAWLSKDSSSLRPSPSDPQCSVGFRLEDCGAQFGGYCGTKSGIDCTLK